MFSRSDHAITVLLQIHMPCYASPIQHSTALDRLHWLLRYSLMPAHLLAFGAPTLGTYPCGSPSIHHYYPKLLGRLFSPPPRFRLSSCRHCAPHRSSRGLSELTLVDMRLYILVVYGTSFTIYRILDPLRDMLFAIPPSETAACMKLSCRDPTLANF
jgi:hypothetical protein